MATKVNDSTWIARGLTNARKERDSLKNGTWVRVYKIDSQIETSQPLPQAEIEEPETDTTK